MFEAAGSEAGEARAWAWVSHLREGGSTPWSAWAGTGERAGRVLPGAQQLELLRRLNLAGRPDPALAERVLTASAPGRGRPDLELVGAAPPTAFGPSPVDPAELPVDELIRVATLLLAADLVADEPPERPDDLRSLAASVERRWRHRGEGPWLRPWRTKYRIVGDPWPAEWLRTELRDRGRPPGGRGSVVLLLASDLATMLADAWTDRAFATATPVPTWRAWLDAQAERPHLPRGIEPPAALAFWTSQVGRERVRLVLDPGSLPALVGVRRLPAVPRPSADAGELARRTSAALGLLVTPPRGRRLLREVLLPRLVDAPGPRLAVPPEHHRWVTRRSRRMRDAVLAGDYPVVGDPDALVARTRVLAAAEPGEPAEPRVLDLAVGLLLDRTPRQEDRP